MVCPIFGEFIPRQCNVVIKLCPDKQFPVWSRFNQRQYDTDVNAKWTILEQTQSNSMPVAVALFG